MRVEVCATFDAPIDRVWSVVEIVDEHVRWMRDAESIRFRTGLRRGVGAEFVCRTRIGPFRTDDVLRVVAWDAPHLLAIRHTGTVTGEGRFRLDPIGPDGTRLCWAEELRFPWWLLGPVGARLARPFLQRLWRDNLARLGAIVAGP